MICNNCGEELKIGDDYVEFAGNPYCSDECVHDMIDAEIIYGIVGDDL